MGRRIGARSLQRGHHEIKESITRQRSLAGAQHFVLALAVFFSRCSLPVPPSVLLTSSPAGAIFSSTPPPLSVPVTASEVTYARWDLLFSHFGFAVCQRLQSGTLSLSTAPSSTSMSLCSKSTVGAVRKRPRGERVVVVTARRQTSSPGQVDPAPHAGSVHPCFDRRRLLRGGWAVCHESSRGTNCVLWLCQLLVDRARARSIHAKNGSQQDRYGICRSKSCVCEC